MKIVYSLDQRVTDQPVVLTIGKFDCVHLGHQYVIRAVVERAQTLGYHSAVMTFDPHPYLVIFPQRELRLLTTVEERAELIAQLGVDTLVVAPFTRETMSTPAEAYMRQICRAMPLRELWVGETFALGRNREGTVPHLQEIGREFGYTVEPLPQRHLAGTVMSTSRVRKLLSRGEVQNINMLLGRPFELCGIVERGDQRGASIGFPTANLVLDPNRALPADGVYACRVLIDQQTEPVLAVTNIGIRPTFGSLHRTVETHLIDWQGNLYGHTLRLQFFHCLRGEQKFPSLGELVAQIARDVEHTRTLLG